MRAVVVAGVDVRDTQLHRLAQHGHGSVAVGGRAEDMRAGQLHRAVPMRVTVRSSAMVNVPPGSVSTAMRFLSLGYFALPACRGIST